MTNTSHKKRSLVTVKEKEALSEPLLSNLGFVPLQMYQDNNHISNKSHFYIKYISHNVLTLAAV